MISQSSLEDVKELNLLVNSAYRGESSKAGWTTEADLLGGIRMDEERLIDMIEKKDSVILKFTEGNEIIGCVHLEKQNDQLYLGMLTVKPNLQGVGLGKKFLLTAEEHARKLNCKKIFMTVLTLRDELIAWYVRHGYTNTGIKKPFPAGDPRFGLPKTELEFVVLEKGIVAHD